ncbi:MAG: hypothetical protein MHM6MM_001086 [Cercozoa sp. M6MM]
MAQLRVLGISLDGLRPRGQFVLLSALMMAFFLANGYVEEKLLKEQNFRYVHVMTTFELLAFAAFAAFERSTQGEAPRKHKAPLRAHALVAGAMLLSRVFTNLSILHLSYPTQIVFKSLKLLSIMLGSVLLLKKYYNPADVSAAFLLCTAAASFAMGDALGGSKQTTAYGIVLVSLSLLGDALHTNVQELAMTQYKAPPLEVLQFTNGIAGLVQLCFTLLFSGEVAPALSSVSPSIFLVLVLRAALVYAGALCFVTLIKHFGSVAATTMTTVRKVLSVLFSFLAFTKPFGTAHVAGIALFGLGLWLSAKGATLRKEEKHDSWLASWAVLLGSRDRTQYQRVHDNSNETAHFRHDKVDTFLDDDDAFLDEHFVELSIDAFDQDDAL